ncbi:MAG: molybdopterin-dependent oxidoreductase [Dehalococcoidales bacterium]|nr:molybdopterin-dependent oxidoreductase [Dehalococcoidales bacterium]
MKKWLHNTRILLLVLLMVALVSTTVAGCSNTTQTTSEPPASGSILLTVVKGTTTKTFTMNQLQAMTVADGSAALMSSTGKITGPNQYKGVAFTTLIDAVGGISANEAVSVTAKDGYSMTFSYNQVTSGKFTSFDVITGKEKPATPETLIAAYELDGNTISDTEGPIRALILSDQETATEGHWWVKWLTKIEVIPAPAVWTLKLEGAISEEMDAATFESGAAPGCHGESWTDTENRVWTGIPLWRLVGYMDDVTPHDKKTGFNDELADNGAYTVQVIASDGFSQTFAAAQVKHNDKWIIAYERDGAALPENQFPLRLVGEGLTKGQMVGKIMTIKLVFP